MTGKILPLVLLLSSLAAGCTGSGDSILDQFAGPSSDPLELGEGTITGDFGVNGFGLGGAFAWSDRSTNSSSQEQGFIVMSDDPNMCDDMEAVALAADSEFVIVQVTVVTSTVDAPTEPGEFELEGSSGNVAFATYYELDAACAFTEDVALTTGTVTLTEAISNRFVGTFDGDTSGGDRVRGGFNPASCLMDSFLNATSVACN